jgi:hypothetical protein
MDPTQYYTFRLSVYCIHDCKRITLNYYTEVATQRIQPIYFKHWLIASHDNSSQRVINNVTLLLSGERVGLLVMQIIIIHIVFHSLTCRRTSINNDESLGYTRTPVGCINTTHILL